MTTMKRAYMHRFTHWIYLVSFALGLINICAGGIGSSSVSDVCIQVEREIRALLVNQKQAEEGIEGNALVPNACKELVEANVMAARSDEDQQLLCANTCFSTLAEKYNTLLVSDCYPTADSDADASARQQAAAYQIACQTTADGQYCIPLLATVVSDAGDTYSLCSDIVEKLGCCFQSYKQYMLLGTPASITAMDEAQTSCTSSGVSNLDQMCPCGTDNSFNPYALNGTMFCSDAWVREMNAWLVTAVTTVFLTLTIGI